MSITSYTDINLICFGSVRYFGQIDLLEETANVLMDAIEKKASKQLEAVRFNRYIITKNEDLKELSHLSFAVLIPMSGAIQPLITALSKEIDFITLWACYIKGQTNKNTEDLVLKNNAAPALMDTFAVLKRTYKNIELSKSIDEIYSYYKVANAIIRFKSSTLLMIGKTEPWVISSVKDYDYITKKFGIKVEQISLKQLYDFYYAVPEEKAKSLASNWEGNATKVVEPTKQDLINSARLALAIQNAVTKYSADAVALACFKMLHELGTTGCMSLSLLNDSDTCVGACEADIDAALTLLLSKCITNKPAFMANPNIQPDGKINFAHCTSALNTSSNEDDKFILRSHHESGIGVSPQVSLKTNSNILSIRIGDNLTKMTVLKGKTQTPIKEPTCRTKILIDYENPQQYIDTTLGCHQILTYDTDYETFIRCGKILGLK